ncbi:MAG: hypothetical protein ACRELE_02795, partial [Gemmatimonadales bacterium]
MPDPLSRRDAIRILGVAGAAAALPGAIAGQTLATPVLPGRQGRADILPLTSTSEVFIPPRGRAFDKFSFDFPEPSVAFDGLRFGFLVFNEENVYGLDQSG